MMDFAAFIQWAFLGIVSSGVFILWQMKESVSALNTKIEVLVVSHQQARSSLDDHEVRIRSLERV